MSEAVITVLRGNPTSDEVAALVGVLAGRARPETERAAPAAVRAWWASGLPQARLRTGPDAWRTSGLPR
jgi:acyl-CoA carboxylase epsilon subunit-like protein